VATRQNPHPHPPPRPSSSPRRQLRRQRNLAAAQARVPARKAAAGPLSALSSAQGYGAPAPGVEAAAAAWGCRSDILAVGSSTSGAVSTRCGGGGGGEGWVGGGASFGGGESAVAAGVAGSEALMTGSGGAGLDPPPLAAHDVSASGLGLIFAVRQRLLHLPLCRRQRCQRLLYMGFGLSINMLG
jgi:hypothetical protein